MGEGISYFFRISNFVLIYRVKEIGDFRFNSGRFESLGLNFTRSVPRRIVGELQILDILIMLLNQQEPEIKTS